MRIIDAEAFEESVDHIEWYHLAESGEMVQGATSENAWYKATDIYNAINNAPTIEAKPAVHASWVEVSGGRIICDHCGNYPLYDYFGRINLSRCCPICGALMSNGSHWLFRKAEEYLKENNCGAQMDESISCSHEDDKPFPQTHENGVKIPVISMEDVPKLMEEKE